MSKHSRLLVASTLLTGAMLLGGVTAGQEPQEGGDRRVIPFPVAELFFELNDSDGDLGIHAEVDGETWTALEIEGPGDRTLFSLSSRSSLRVQGLTQLAFESAEPTFDELDPADFFKRFPEGVYEFSARTPDGRMESKVRLSHVLAAAPGNVRLNGLPAARNCDAPVLPEVDGPVLIDWDPVSTSHPEIGKAGRVTIARYQFFVERQNGKLSSDLPPTQTEYEVRLDAADRGDVIKFEIIARTSTGNNTAIESCFRVR